MLLNKLVPSFKKFSDRWGGFEHHHVDDRQLWNEWRAELGVRDRMRHKKLERDAMRIEFFPGIEMLAADCIDVAAGAGRLTDGEHSVFRL
jgi:hypothetical protein